MAGIIAYGAYVPYNRITRETIGKALETRGGKGERSVAGFDEDSVTMGVEACRAFLKNGLKEEVASLFFATTSAPYQEKLNAGTIHAALELNPEIFALDLGGSVRAGMGALLAAAGNASANGNVSLAVMSDIRVGAPEGAAELNGGDGAAAFLLGEDGVIAEIESTFSKTLEHQALWRLPGEQFAKNWEDRFGMTQVYVPLLVEAGKALAEQSGVAASDLKAVIIDAPLARAVGTVAKSLGLDKRAIVDDMGATVGHTGAAHAALMLASALDGAQPGDRIAVLSVSDGVEGILLCATDAIAPAARPTSVANLIDSKRNDLSYARFLKWRGIIPTERPRRPDPARPAGPPVFRKRHWKFGMIGSECTECGARHLPPQKVCVNCGATDKMKDFPFAEKKGTVATYTLDRLAFTPQPPMVMAMIDFEGGGRVELEITDCDPETVAIGNTVEMTFRRLFTSDGVHNYFWKSRPIR
ncbi:MAG: OB-fold domain-containing protein [Candidatus Hydrogenedentes bacterium]|jgi:3-hydroxy-3-methylglutaryl CoA synthase/uncharacterized OB-fold protein|nr:OB-fold domain-containing protein [Candidatus Hydrogenedentota bacterium]